MKGVTIFHRSVFGTLSRCHIIPFKKVLAIILSVAALIITQTSCSLRSQSDTRFIHVYAMLHQGYVKNCGQLKENLIPWLISEVYIARSPQINQRVRLHEDKKKSINGSTIDELMSDDMYEIIVDGGKDGRFKVDKELFNNWDGSQSVVIHLGGNGSINIEWHK